MMKEQVFADVEALMGCPDSRLSLLSDKILSECKRILAQDLVEPSNFEVCH
jgi:hypothetical protein